MLSPLENEELAVGRVVDAARRLETARQDAHGAASEIPLSAPRGALARDEHRLAVASRRSPRVLASPAVPEATAMFVSPVDGFQRTTRSRC
jgi:hypothetical protein